MAAPETTIVGDAEQASLEENGQLQVGTATVPPKQVSMELSAIARAAPIFWSAPHFTLNDNGRYFLSPRVPFGPETSGTGNKNVWKEEFFSSREEMVQFAVHYRDSFCNNQVEGIVSTKAGKIGGLRFGKRPFSCCGHRGYTAVEVYVDGVTCYSIPVTGRPWYSGLTNCWSSMEGTLCAPCHFIMAMIKCPFLFVLSCIECIWCKTVIEISPEPVVTHIVLPIYGPQGGRDPVGHLRWTEYDSEPNNIAVLLPRASEQEKKVLAMLAWVWKKFQLGGDTVLKSMTALEDLPTSRQVQNFFDWLGELP